MPEVTLVRERPPLNIGKLQHRVTLENPGLNVPDGDGGYTQSWTALSPSPVWAAIAPATARDLERLVANAVQSTATHIVTCRYHPQITTQTRLTFNGRILNVRGVQNLDELNVEMRLACEEKVA
jgi:SPP1 family predicted phage head-tail adaptor